MSKAQKVETAFATLERFAVEGLRCPENGTHGVDSNMTCELAKQGRIRIEVGHRNFRVITILVGPNAGKQTAPFPKGSSIYKVIDKNGTRVNGRPFEAHRERYVLPMTRAERDRRGI